MRYRVVHVELNNEKVQVQTQEPSTRIVEQSGKDGSRQSSDSLWFLLLSSRPPPHGTVPVPEYSTRLDLRFGKVDPFFKK